MYPPLNLIRRLYYVFIVESTSITLCTLRSTFKYNNLLVECETIRIGINHTQKINKGTNFLVRLDLNRNTNAEDHPFSIKHNSCIG